MCIRAQNRGAISKNDMKIVLVNDTSAIRACPIIYVNTEAVSQIIFIPKRLTICVCIIRINSARAVTSIKIPLPLSV